MRRRESSNEECLDSFDVLRVKDLTPVYSAMKYRSPLSNLGAVLCCALVCVTAISVQANTITVTNINDSGPGSLRQALAGANDGDTIDFAVTGTIGLTSGELLVNKSITISGAAPNSLVVRRSSNTQFRIFHVMPSVTATIAGLTINSGEAGQQGGGGILNDHATLTIDNCAVHNSFALQDNYGGGIYNDGSAGSATLTILNSVITSNHAYSAGGGIYNDASNGGSATLTITNTSVSENQAAFISDVGLSGGEGGGIFNDGGTVIITNSNVNDNSAGLSDPPPASFGGGISNYGTLTITNSTINGNQCGWGGGGISNSGALTVVTSTVSNNAAASEYDGKPYGVGGGISGGTLTFTNSTLSGNYANVSVGGIGVAGGTITNSTISGNNGSVSFGGGGLEIGNTILNASAGSANITNYGGTLTSHGYNLSSDDGGGYLNGPGDQINTDPLLGPLQNNGGPTLTHALLTGSPAIDAGNPSFTPPPWNDQRGPDFYRLRNNRLDIGSFEVQEGPAVTPTPTPTPTPSPTPTATPRPVPTPRSRPSPYPRPTSR